MKYPSLLKQFLNTTVYLTITSDETGTNGKVKEIISNKKYQCNYQSANVKNSTNIERSVRINSIIMIPGDIFKNCSGNYCGGTATVNCEKHDITDISLVRNPDGTVNYTRIVTK